MMTHDEFIEEECRFCGSQRCYGVEFCNKYKVNVFSEKDDYDPYTGKYAFCSPSNNDLGFGEDWASESPEMPDEDREAAEAAQEAHDNLVRSLIEADGEINELIDEKMRLIHVLKSTAGWLNYFLNHNRNDAHYDDASEALCCAEYLLMDLEV